MSMTKEHELTTLVTKPRKPKRKYSFHGVKLLRHTAVGVPVYLMKENSTGEKATLRNADHHAKAVKPMAVCLMGLMDLLDATKWIQGNNVHVIVTLGGTEYRWRPMWRREEDGSRYYYGLKCLRVEKDNNQTCVLEVTNAEQLRVVINRWIELLETT